MVGVKGGRLSLLHSFPACLPSEVGVGPVTACAISSDGEGVKGGRLLLVGAPEGRRSCVCRKF